MIPANLLINADDFGLDARVSAAIARGVDEGIIRSFSVFPFSDPWHAGLLSEIARKHPEAGIGAHLSVVGPGLPEGPGHFRDFLWRYATGRFPAARVRETWRSQIVALRDRIRRTPDHLDSHQHLHLLPGLWAAAAGLQREFGIPRLRVPYEGLRACLFHRFPFGAALQALARWRARGEPPAFLGFRTSGGFTVAANREGLARAARDGRVFELMVHPALERPPAGAEGGPRAELRASQFRELDELRALAAGPALGLDGA